MKIQISTILLMAVLVNFTQGKIFNPKTSQEFESAIKEASVGDTIELLPQDYQGDFLLPSKSGSVTIQGTSSSDFKKSTKIFGNGKAFSISGDNWEIRSLSIESGEVGVEITGSNNVLNSLSIRGVKKGVIINGNDNLVNSCSIFGGDHGILVKGSSNFIRSVSCKGINKESIIVESGSISTQIDSTSVKSNGDNQVSVLLKEGSSGGVLNSSGLDGIVQVKGDDYKINSCSFKYALNLFGCNNSVDSSSVRNLYANNKACENVVGQSNSIKAVSDSPVTK